MGERVVGREHVVLGQGVEQGSTWRTLRETTTIPIGLSARLLHRELAVLRGVADVVARRGDEPRELGLERVDGLHRLVDGECGLGEPDHLRRVRGRSTLATSARSVDELDVVGGLAGGADDLLVALVADQQDVVVVVREADGFLVDLGDERAGGVDGGEAATLGFFVDDGGDAVRGEHHDVPRGDLLRPLDEDRAFLLQGLDDVLVVNDLVPDVHRSPVLLQGFLDGDHGAVHTRAVATGGGEQDTAARRSSHGTHRKAAFGGSKIAWVRRCRGDWRERSEAWPEAEPGREPRHWRRHDVADRYDGPGGR
ncbi:hypothetical protein SVIOM342S_01019 [Streptomyces violaceorubidus]